MLDRERACATGPHPREGRAQGRLEAGDSRLGSVLPRLALRLMKRLGLRA